MKLRDLLGTVEPLEIRGSLDRAVDAVVADSRRAVPNALFVAVRGLGFDGHDFIGDALAAGATAILAQSAPPADLDTAVLTWIRLADTEEALGLVLSRFHGEPSRKLSVLAVTGTNGKTTVSWLLKDILEALGHVIGLIGTVFTRVAGETRPTIFTTPPAPIMQPALADMVAAGCDHAILEASSHGLAMHRMSGVEVQVGGFTNLSRDHLDFHETMEAYRAAKARLFTHFAHHACFNVDDPVGRGFAEAFAGDKLTVSQRGATADIEAREVRCRLTGARARLLTPEGERELVTGLVGAHNVENALVALGMARLAGVALDDGLAALATAKGAPGRLERVEGPRHVLVDYAHSPDALVSTLSALRPLTPGRIICVFGAGGDRDRGKRPEMGEVVARLADLPVVTSDNPRSEPPEAIIAEIVAGMPEGSPRVTVTDRRSAIARAIETAGPDDLVLLAGKGHETYQEIEGERLSFDDRAVAREAMTGLGAAHHGGIS